MRRFRTFGRWLTILAILGGVMPVLTGAQVVLPVTGTGNPHYQAIDGLILDKAAAITATAVVWAFSRDGQMLVSKAAGWMDLVNTTPLKPAASMRIGSVSKPITATLIRDLINRGKLKEDFQPYRAWSHPGTGLTITDQRLADITVKQLLEHQGGWDRDAGFDPGFGLPPESTLDFRQLTSRGLVRFMAAMPLQFAPGSKSVYSNFGYIVLGRVIEQLTGTTYRDHLRVFWDRQLKLQDIDVADPKPNLRCGEPAYHSDAYNITILDAAGGLIASAPGLCRFLESFWISGEPRSGRGSTFTFFGSVPGACSLVRQRLDGRNYAVLFNNRKGSLEDLVTAIDKILDDSTD